MKLFAATLATETNTFAVVPTGRVDFEVYGVYRGDASRRAPEAICGTQLAQLQRLAAADGHEVVESLAAFAQPAGPTRREVYEDFRDVLRENYGENTAVVLPSGCRAMAMVLRDGVVASEEGFCDRAYRPDGSLVDRSEPGAVLSDPEEAAAQAACLARGAAVAVDGSVLTLWVDTLCIHGDTPGAETIATAVRQALARAGIDVAAPARA